jgi:AbrB family looped-hinge helix DNA binding protein
MVINAKGQIVIPKALRDRFGIRPGQEVEFKEDHGKIVLIKKGLKEKIEAAVKKYHYKFPAGVKSSTQMLKGLRG